MPKPKQKINPVKLIGRNFGSRRVINYAYDKSNKLIFLLLCKDCGGKTILRETTICNYIYFKKRNIKSGSCQECAGIESWKTLTHKGAKRILKNLEKEENK